MGGWLTAVRDACTIIDMTHNNTTPTLYDIELWSLDEDGTLANSLGLFIKDNATWYRYLRYRDLLYTHAEIGRQTALEALTEWTDGAWREQMARIHPHGWHAIYVPVDVEELS